MLNAVNLSFVAFSQAVRRGRAGVRVLRDDGRRRRSRGRARDHHRDLPPPPDGEPPEHQPPQRADAASSQEAAARRAPARGHRRRVDLARAAAAAARLPRSTGCCRCVAATHIGPGGPVGAHGTITAHGTRHARGPRRDHDDAPSRRRAIEYAGIVSIVGPARARLVVRARGRDLLRDARRATPKRRSSRRYFTWMPAGDLHDRRRAPARPALDRDDAGHHRRRAR